MSESSTALTVHRPVFKKTTAHLVVALISSLGLGTLWLLASGPVALTRHAFVALPLAIVAILAAVGWVFYAYRNLEALGHATRISAGLAAVAAFVPIGSFFVGLELWKKSAPAPAEGIAPRFSSTSPWLLGALQLLSLIVLLPAPNAALWAALSVASLLLSLFVMVNIELRQRLRARQLGVS